MLEFIDSLKDDTDEETRAAAQVWVEVSARARVTDEETRAAAQARLQDLALTLTLAQALAHPNPNPGRLQDLGHRHAAGSAAFV